MRSILFVTFVLLFIQSAHTFGMFASQNQEITVNVNSPQSPEAKAVWESWNTTGWINNTQSFLGRNKYNIMLLGLLGGYGYLSYQLIQTNNIIKNGNAWSAWKYHVNFEQLCETPHEDLTRELLNDIQRQYINYQNPTDFVSPLSTFAQDLEREHKLLNQYIKIGGLLHKAYLLFLFPINEDSISAAHERLERLNFVRHLFVSWSAQHNLQQNNAIGHVVKKIIKI